jgi:protein O-mannosyl-transferase
MSQRPKNNQLPKTSSLPFPDRNADGRECRVVGRSTVLAVCGFLLLAVALVFGKTVRYDFVNFDDKQYVYENPDLARGLNAQQIARAFTTTRASNWHPLTWLSYMLDYCICGLKPWGYHLGNVLLHAATVILLLLVLWRMTGDFWPSAFVAAVFAIHPLQVESVAWVAERKDVLSGLFFVLTLGAYVGYVRRPFSFLRYLAVVVLFALGLMAKPMLVTLPFVLLLLDYWPLDRMALRWRLLLEKLPLFVLSGASCVATSIAQREVAASLDLIPFSARVANALVSYAVYVGHLVYPMGLAVFYPHPGNQVPVWQVIVALLLLACISVGVLAWRRKAPYLLVGWCWYLGMLVPVIGLVQVGSQSMADRYTYLPQIGLVIGLAWGAKRVLESRPRYVDVCVVASALAVAFLMGCAWQQTSYWRDSETLWRHAIACTPPNAVAHNNLGSALDNRERMDEKIAEYREALRLQPNFAYANCNLGVALAERGQIDEAIACFEKALKAWPNYFEAHSNLGKALASRGQFDEAIAHYEKAIKAEPDNAVAYFNLGVALAACRRMDEAMARFQEAIQLRSNYPEAHNNLGIALGQCGRFDEAVAHFNKALKINPDYADAQRNLNMARSLRGKLVTALAERRESLRSQPNDIALLNQTAWMLATNPNASIRNGAEAIELAQRAVELPDGRQPAVLGTLAAAYAETGQFAKAIETAQQALALVASQGNGTLADSLRARIRLYQAGSPYHETQQPSIPKSGQP